MRGFAALPVVIIVVLLVLTGGGIYFYTTNQSNESVTVSPSPSPVEEISASPSAALNHTPTPVPTIKPTPAASKTTAPTATPTAVPSATPTAQAPSCMTSNELGNLVVYIQSIDGPIVGDAAVTMSNGKGGDCPAVDSRLPYIQVISQGSRSVTFSGYRIGNYHVTLSYHGKNYDSAVEIKPGDNPINFNVSN